MVCCDAMSTITRSTSRCLTALELTSEGTSRRGLGDVKNNMYNVRDILVLWPGLRGAKLERRESFWHHRLALVVLNAGLCLAAHGNRLQINAPQSTSFNSFCGVLCIDHTRRLFCERSSPGRVLAGPTLDDKHPPHAMWGASELPHRQPPEFLLLLTTIQAQTPLL